MSRRFSTIFTTAAADGRNVALTFAVLAVLAGIRLAICLAGASCMGSMRIEPLNLIVVFSVAIVMLAIGIYCSAAHKMVALGLMLGYPTVFLLSGIASFEAQYVLFYLGRQNDLIDDKLAAIDAMLGFDWPAYCKWMFAHPTVERITTLAYGSIWLQPVVLSLLFCLTKQLRDYLALSMALPLSFVLTCLVAVYLPALGAYQFHGMTPDHHVGIALEFTDGMTAPMQWLRQGDFSGPRPTFPDMRLITFPSWHAAAAAIFMISLWSWRGLRWGGLILNALMLMSTPVQGSHYLTDMIIGFAIGGVSCWMSAGILRKPKAYRDPVDLRNMAPV